MTSAAGQVVGDARRPSPARTRPAGSRAAGRTGSRPGCAPCRAAAGGRRCRSPACIPGVRARSATVGRGGATTPESSGGIRSPRRRLDGRPGPRRPQPQQVGRRRPASSPATSAAPGGGGQPRPGVPGDARWHAAAGQERPGDIGRCRAQEHQAPTAASTAAPGQTDADQPAAIGRCRRVAARRHRRPTAASAPPGRRSRSRRQRAAPSTGRSRRCPADVAEHHGDDHGEASPTSVNRFDAWNIIESSDRQDDRADHHQPRPAGARPQEPAADHGEQPDHAG